MMDIEEEMAKILSEELAKEIDKQIIGELFKKKYSRTDKIKNILDRIEKSNKS